MPLFKTREGVQIWERVEEEKDQYWLNQGAKKNNYKIERQVRSVRGNINARHHKNADVLRVRTTPTKAIKGVQ